MYEIIKPPFLQEMLPPPKQLYLKGGYDSLRPAVAIVGTRRPSNDGAKAAFILANELAQRGVLIISGLAYGVDLVAHQGALAANGSTLAVLPSGINRIYPASHRSIADQILASGGGLVSEHSGNLSPRKHDFLARNRIIAGLAQLTIVVEAANRSGALNTARHALDMNRDLMAMPGSVFNPLAEGPNNLIKQGAQPVTSYKDVIDLLGVDDQADRLMVAMSQDQLDILELLNNQLLTIEQLLTKSKLETTEAMVIISELEIHGLIKRLPGNYIKRC